MIAHAHVGVTCVHAIMLYTSVYLSMYRALPRTESIFLVFVSSFVNTKWVGFGSKVGVVKNYTCTTRTAHSIVLVHPF